jgi:hypothetical protein
LLLSSLDFKVFLGELIGIVDNFELPGEDSDDCANKQILELYAGVLASPEENLLILEVELR